MSTITRERLEQLANFRGAPVTRQEEQELARIALESQGAKKIILYRERNPYNGLTTGWEELTEQEYEIVKDNASKHAEFRTVYTAPPAPVVPAELHPDTQKLVTDFCTALAEKLYKAQLKYGYDTDWKQDGWPTQCQAHFHQHIAKGDPRDVAAYCAFMWYHGWKTEPAPVSVPDFKKLAHELVENLVDCDGADDSAVKQYLKWTEKTCRDAMLQGAEQQQNLQQNIQEIIPRGLVEAVNNLLNNDGSRGRYSAMGCGEAREKIELWLAQRQKWELQRSQNLSAGNSPVIPDEKGSSLQLRNLIRQRHAEWSQATFGDVGPVGPLKHLSKEALEAAAEPNDLSEWADMQFLLWDAQRRAGISDGEITAAMEEKLKVNMARQWPAPKDGEPRLHIKTEPLQEVKQCT